MSKLDLDAAGTLHTLTGRLTRHGVTVAGLDKWQELTAALSPRPAPAMPEGLLDRTPDELHAYAQRVAIHRSIAHGRPGGYQATLTELRAPLDLALLESIRDNASDIIAQLRPSFDKAADAIRKAVALGVKHDDDLRSLFESDKNVRTVWLAAQNHARALDDILTTRQQLSVVAGVQPAPEQLGPNQPREGTGISWSGTVTAAKSGASLGQYNPAAPWQRWLAVAQHLELTDPAGVTAWDSFAQSSRGTANRLSSEAQRRHDGAKAAAALLVDGAKQEAADRAQVEAAAVA